MHILNETEWTRKHFQGFKSQDFYQLLRRPYGSNGRAAATIAITMYSAAQIKMGIGVLV